MQYIYETKAKCELTFNLFSFCVAYRNLYTDATKIAGTYSGIIEDQIYYFFYSQQ